MVFSSDKFNALKKEVENLKTASLENCKATILKLENYAATMQYGDDEHKKLATYSVLALEQIIKTKDDKGANPNIRDAYKRITLEKKQHGSKQAK